MNIRNLPAKPNNGGIPAKDIKLKTIKTEYDCIPPTNFNSFKVLTKRTSTKKNKAKILNNKIK